ncbi:MAG: non-homologous end-joining DNA ligase, partial [Planctomycetota bacterium]
MGDIKEYREKRDFGRTPEPSGSADRPIPEAAARRFVVQKHAARRTHFDLRLEIGGTLVSWAVPKGPSADPEAKRLAVHVEDHPLEYGNFEGTIPKGEYGAGAVIIWDRGRYQPVGDTPDSEEGLKRGLHEGKLDLVFSGERLRGRWALVRMKGRDGEDNWLLLKKKDVYAEPGDPEGLVERFQDSVVSGRPVDDPSFAEEPDESAQARAPVDTQPMLAQRAEKLPSGDAWGFELKLDGIRAVGWVEASGQVRIYSRRGHRLEHAFPEISEALELLAHRSGSAFVLDGEIVAARADGGPRFEDLQPRFNLKEAREIAQHVRERPAEIHAFDLLWLDGEDVRDHPLSVRKEKLRQLLRSAGHRIHYVGHDVASGTGTMEESRRGGFEGVVAKLLKSRYRSGERSQDWLKVKELVRQEFVVGGWTEPQGGRQSFGALVVGYYDEAGLGGAMRCAGRVGSGFSDDDLRVIGEKLAALAQESSPFGEIPDDVRGSHWVRPELVAEVKYQEWTREGRLRQPVFVGVRRDVDPSWVVREGRATMPSRGPTVELPSETQTLIQTLEGLEKEGSDGDIVVEGRRLKVSNLQKVFWPDANITKGDLLRYYASVGPAILPAVEGRPLTLERYPNGITGEMFYQQRVIAQVPEGVRTVELDL